MNDQKKILVINLLTEQGVYDSLYSQRISDADIEGINTLILSEFTGGAKWYHNFISKKYHKQYRNKRDAFNSYKRTIQEFRIDSHRDVKINEQLSMQLVRFTLTGNSFGYNQIRKMVSSVAEVAALGGSMDILRKSFDPKVMKHNNNAPSQGLMLWSANFDRYNEKLKALASNGHSVEYNIGISDETYLKMDAFRE